MSQSPLVIVPVNTTGVDASAEGEDQSHPAFGRLTGIFLKYHASAPATTSVTITDETTGNVLADAIVGNTNILLIPKLPVVEPDGDAISDVYEYMPVGGNIKVAVTLSNELINAVTAYMYLAE